MEKPVKNEDVRARTLNVVSHGKCATRAGTKNKNDKRQFCVNTVNTAIKTGKKNKRLLATKTNRKNKKSQFICHTHT